MRKLFCHTCKGEDGVSGRAIQYGERHKIKGHDVEDITKFKRTLQRNRKNESDIRKFSATASNDRIKEWWNKNKNMHTSSFRR